MARDGEARGPDAQKGTYGRIYDPALKRTEYAHRVVWRRVYGPIPRGLNVDHACNITGTLASAWGRRFEVHSNRLRKVVGIKSELGAMNQARRKDPFRVSSMSHPTPMISKLAEALGITPTQLQAQPPDA